MPGWRPTDLELRTGIQLMSAPAGTLSATALPLPGREQFGARPSQNVRLGPLHIGIRSNENPFAELHYFPTSVRLPPGAPIHYRINCCNIGIDGPWPLQDIREARDKSYRGGRFAAG